MKTHRVAKVVVTDGSRLLMARRSMSVHSRQGQWDFLGGGGEPHDKKFKDIARREVYEEGGLNLPNSRLIPFHEVQYEKPFSEGGRRLIIAKYFVGLMRPLPDEVPPHSDEHTEIRAFSLPEALEVNNYERQRDVLVFMQEHNLLQEVARYYENV